LILFPLFLLSQKANIDQRNETVILDKEKTIDVAKIILNESRLRSFIDSLKIELAKLEMEIMDFEKLTVDRLNAVKKLNFENARLQAELLSFAEEHGSTKKPRQKATLYLYPSISGSKEGIISTNFGAAFSFDRSFYSFQVDPLTNPFVSYQIGIGYKIF